MRCPARRRRHECRAADRRLGSRRNRYRGTELRYPHGPRDGQESWRIRILRVDHVPAMEGEHVAAGALTTGTAGSAQAVGYETMGQLFAVGYLKGLLKGQGIPFE
jgi:hypothetical protein